ncbi:MAG: tripartite tricarboxylate transporter substrate binding protein [Reyranella sp.]|nr:tripartite tricarboxylate transporter substrate binding protein [Reyranella sp.]
MTLYRRTALAGVLASGMTGFARATDFPSRQMNWIVPFPPGGSNDIFARPVAAFVGERLGQPIVVENRGGAGGTIGGMTAARSKPDGCTLLVVNPSLTFASIVYAESGFDLMRDFAPVSGMAQVPVALVVNPSKIAAKDLAGFLALARKAPGAINIGSSGLGTIPHLAIVLLQQKTGIQLTHVPYRGGGPALQDMMAGQIDATFAPLSTVASYVQSGRLRALAVAAPRREPVLPDVPTFAQAGVPDFTVSTWYGLFAPKATPVAILDTLHGAVQAALADPGVKHIWAEQGAEPDLQSRTAFTDFVTHEVERWSKIARTVGLPME